MGLFDTIHNKLYCPYCGKQQEEFDFQSKDLGDMMDTWTIEEIKKVKTRKKEDDTRIYSHCRYCNKWIEIVIIGERKIE